MNTENTITTAFENSDFLEKGATGRGAPEGAEKIFNVGGKDVIYHKVRVASGKLEWRPKPKGERASSNSDGSSTQVSLTPKTPEDHARSLTDVQLEAVLNNSKLPAELHDIAVAEKIRREEIKAANVNPFEEHIGELPEKADKHTGRRKLTVDERWDAYAVNSQMVIDGDAKSMIAYGTGGVGKTFEMLNTLKMNNFKAFDHEKGHKSLMDANQDSYEDMKNFENYDYVKITGKGNMTELWKTLYEHNGKLIIFDDCDGFLDNGEAVDILKGALDTTGDGVIQYKELKIVGPDGEPFYLPKRIKFRGRVAMITNRKASDFEEGDLQAFKSRSLMSNLTMTKDETLTKLKQILPYLTPTNVHGKEIAGVSIKDKQEVFKFIEDNIDHINLSDLNGRSFGSGIKMLKTAQKLNKEHKPLLAPIFGLSSWNK